MKLPLPNCSEGRSLADRATASLREALLKGHFEPGERLDVDRISTELDVSIIPAREAFSRLEAEGLLRSRPHRGVFVTSFNRKDIEEVYSVRQLLEVEAIRQATCTIPGHVLDSLDQFVADEIRRLESGDFSQHLGSDARFHNSFLDFVDNQVLRGILQTLSRRVDLIRVFSNIQPGPHMIGPVREHHAVLEAIRLRDPETAARKMALHIENSARYIKELPWVEP